MNDSTRSRCTSLTTAVLRARTTTGLALLIALAAGGCGGGGGGGSGATVVVGRFALVLTLDAVVVHELPTLHPLAYIPLGAQARGAALDPLQRHIFVTLDDGGPPRIAVLALDPDQGSLVPVAGSPFLLPAGADLAPAVDPQGEFVFLGGLGLHAFALDGTAGTLAPVAGSPFAAATGFDSLAVDPSGTFVIACLGSQDQVRVFALDRGDGSLDELPGSPYAVGDQPSAAAFHPNGRFVYVANAVSDDVSAFSIAGDGALTPLAGSPVAGGNGPLDITLDPSGRFLVTADESGGTVTSFVVDPVTGALTPAPGGSQHSGALANGIAPDPDGASVYAIASGAHEIVAFELEPDGDLVRTRTARSRRTPVDLLVVEGARRPQRVSTFAYAASRLSAQIEGFTVDPSDGSLAELASSPVSIPSHSNALAVDVHERYLYAGHDGGGIEAFTIATDGALDLVAGSPFAPAVGVGAMTSEPSGRFLYVSSASLVHAFAIDAATGALSALAGSPFDFALGGQISHLAVDPTGRALVVATGGLAASCAIDVATGELAFVLASDFSVQSTRGVGFLPDGRFAYLPSGTQAELTRVPVSGSTAALQGATASAVTTEPQPSGIAVHPTGPWLFLPHPGAGVGVISAFAVDLANGVPAELAASPFGDGASPNGLRIDASGRWLYALDFNTDATWYEVDTSTGVLTPRGVAHAGLFDPLDLVLLGRIE